MSLRIFKDTTVPKYKSGKWLWDDFTESFTFVQKERSFAEPECVIPTPIQRRLYKFKFYMNQVDEIIFNEHFSRPEYSNDENVITVQDIKNFVLFMAPSEILTDKLIDFLYTRTIDRFLNALVIYFEYFLKIVEFLLIRRDAVSEQLAGIETMESLRIKTMVADYLSQYRILLAREYCKIILGTEDMASFHHVDSKVRSSRVIKDRAFQEAFLAFITYFTWVAHHRRAYNIIDTEINRLIVSGHFNKFKPDDCNTITFSRTEEQILYGRQDKRANFREQRSPLVQEIINCSKKDLPLLWLGETKYRGTDPRMYELELEFVVPESQLTFIDITHGILGHPKRFYNTMLVLDWHTVRKENFSEHYDPYKIWGQPYFILPNWENYNKKHKSFEPYFKLTDMRYQPEILRNQKSIWKQRDRIVREIKKQGVVNNIILQCEKEVADINKDIRINKNQIIADFLLEKNKRKLK